MSDKGGKGKGKGGKSSLKEGLLLSLSLLSLLPSNNLSLSLISILYFCFCSYSQRQGRWLSKVQEDQKCSVFFSRFDLSSLFPTISHFRLMHVLIFFHFQYFSCCFHQRYGFFFRFSFSF